MTDEIFDRLDRWRHLPGYQLERRADIFFSLHLPEIISRRYQVEVNSVIVPELPLRLGTLYPDSETNRSVKVDYFMMSSDGTKGYLVELKTDQASRRSAQDEYLRVAQKLGLPAILDGLIKIFKATRAKGKYLHLFQLLEELDLVAVPAELHPTIGQAGRANIDRLIDEIEVTMRDPELNIVYLQPNGDKDEHINFAFMAVILREIGDPISLRFADSLDEWATVEPGEATDRLHDGA